MRRNARMTPEGTCDFLFEECLARRSAENILSNLFLSRGFFEVMTPGIEFYDVFDAGSPVLSAQSMYKMTDAKGRILVMRPDSTLPIARLTATRLKGVPLPIRLYYAQDVYRFNRGQNGGHSDQEFQAGIELIGAKGERADIEVLFLAAKSMELFNVGEYRLEIGHVGFFLSLIKELDVDDETRDNIRVLIENKDYAALGELLDTLPPGDAVDAIRRLPRLFGGEEVLEEAASLCQNDVMKTALGYLDKLYKKLCDLGLSKRVMIDLGLVHHNEYYTGVIFRGYIEGGGDNVISGGRYDTLIGRFGRDIPATGFGVNLDLLARLMLAGGSVKPPKPPEVLVHAEPGFETAALKKADELAERGVTCEVSVFDSVDEARIYADKRCISKVLKVGKEEKGDRK